MQTSEGFETEKLSLNQNQIIIDKQIHKVWIKLRSIL